jgi:predicted GNAT family N-acyltransferase
LNNKLLKEIGEFLSSQTEENPMNISSEEEFTNKITSKYGLNEDSEAMLAASLVHIRMIAIATR